jgi:hypothetical protein
MEKRDGTGEAIGHFIGDVIGWIFLMAIAAGAYFLGYAVAGYFGGAEHKDAFGLLSAIVLIWMYEHRLAEERWQRFLQRPSNPLG